MASLTKVAIVTGANKGLGFAIVRKLCKEFSGDVYLTARNEELGKVAVAKLEAEGLRPRFHQLDITSTESIESLKHHIVDNYGGLDVLVNNAGMAYKVKSTASFLEQATNTLKTNFTGTLNVSKALVPILRPHGRVLNISATNSRLSILQKHLQDKLLNPGLTETELVELMDQFVADIASGTHIEKGWPNTAYGVSYVGITALTRILAREVAKSGKEDALVNCSCPGKVQTDMSGDKGTRTPEQAAETLVFLALLPPGSPSGELWRDKEIKRWETIEW